MWFRGRGPHVSPITDVELVNQPATTPRATARHDDADSQLLRAVNCFSTPSDFSPRSWAMWQQYSNWYLNHIKQRIRVWMADDEFCQKFQLLKPNGQQTSSAHPPNTSEVIVVLSQVATTLRDGKSSLSDIIISLLEPSGCTDGNDCIADRFVTFQEGEDPVDIQRGHKCQVVFDLLSCILLLYTPSSSPQVSHLQLQLNDPDDKEKVLRSHLLKKSSCLLTADVTTLTFEHLLNCFGHLRFQTMNGSSREQIIAGNVNYFILSKVAGIRIVWVDYLSLHLEFDRRTMTLKLFRFPSFCAMLALPRDSKATIFDSIFQSQKDDFESYNAKAQNIVAYSQDFFVEVLCSYRVLFSQHKKARDLYLERFRITSSRQADDRRDPLRDQICGTPSHKNLLFDSIDAFPEKSTYWSDCDFPNLGDRLLEIQDFVISQDSGSFRALWYDVRDLNRFWTFWAVVVFGVTSTVLSIIQTVLTGLQLKG